MIRNCDIVVQSKLQHPEFALQRVATHLFRTQP